MKKLLTLLSLAFTLTVSAQKVDQDTVIVLTTQEAKMITDLLMESRVMIQGQPATGKELQNLISWFWSKAKVFKKEQPK